MIGGAYGAHHNDHLFARKVRRMNDRGKPDMTAIPVFLGPGGVPMYSCKKCLSPKPVSEFQSLDEGKEGSCVCRRCS